MVDESDLLLESVATELRVARADSARLLVVGEHVGDAVQRLADTAQNGIEEWMRAGSSRQNAIMTELTAVRGLLESGVSILKEMRAESEQRPTLSLQQIQVNQFGIAHSGVNSFKYYESLKDIQKSFKYSLAIGKKDSAALINNILLTCKYLFHFTIHYISI